MRSSRHLPGGWHRARPALATGVTAAASALAMIAAGAAGAVPAGPPTVGSQAAGT